MPSCAWYTETSGDIISTLTHVFLMTKRLTYMAAGALIGLPLLVFAFVGTSTGAFFGNEAMAGYGQNKVTICHKGKNTLELPEPAVKAHLNHGDTLGPCP